MTEVYFDYSTSETSSPEGDSSFSPSPKRKSSYAFFLPFIAIVAIGFFMRSYGVELVETAPHELRMVENALLYWDGVPPYNPEHPSIPLIFYWGWGFASLWSAVNFHSLVGMVKTSNWQEMTALISQSMANFYANPFLTILVARVLNAILGTLVLFWCYGIAKKLSGSYFGAFVASACACLAPLLVQAGASLSFSNMLAFASLGAIFFALHHAEKGGRASLALSCILAGLSCAVDIAGFSIVLAVILGAVFVKNSSLKKRFYLILLALVIIVVSWVLFNPYIITDMPASIVGLMKQFNAIAQGFSLTGYSGNLVTLLRPSWLGLGLLPLALAVGGAVFSLLKNLRKSLIALAVIAVYPCFLLSSEFEEQRVVIAGFSACFVGALAGSLAGLLWQREMKTASVFTALALFALGVPAWEGYKVLQARLGSDTRSQAREWLYANAPADSMIVVTEEGPLLPISINCADRNLKRLGKLFWGSDGASKALFMRDASLRKELYLYKRYSYIKAVNASSSPSFDVVELCCEPFELSLFDDVERFWAVVTPQLMVGDSGTGTLGELAEIIRYGGERRAEFKSTGKGNDIVIYEVWTSGHRKAEEDIQP